VFSELVYIEDEEEIDLFDIRYLEQELLYFMRDSGQLRRKRRCLNIILEQDKAFDVTYPHHSYKFSNLLVALMLRLISDLQKIFEAENFVIKIFIEEEKYEITESLKLLQLFLRNEIAQKQVLFPQEEDQRKKIYPLPTLLDPKRKTHTLFLSTVPPPPWLQEQQRELHLLSVLISDNSLKREKPSDIFEILDINKEVLSQILQLRDRILQQLIRA
jgi:hypothetical protein